MRFVDHVNIHVRSGKGGAGCVAFRREMYVPRGGPSGGDGGHGGSVLIRADPQLHTLLDLRYHRHQFAPAGRAGEGNNRTGKDGDDIVLRVPCGTIAKVTGSGELIGEVVQPKDQLLLVQGGRGGKGNAFFKSPSQQVPRFAQPGEPGEEKRVTLELKMLADVGLVGLPNAGKSTLVASVSAARPKIADYPFTTLVPMPGVVRVGDYQSFVMADIPGIVEGASEGRGLGFRFLRHIERNAVLLLLVPVTSEDPVVEYRLLMQELAAYDAALQQKPRLVAFSKSDLLPEDVHESWLDARRREFEPGVELFLISAVATQGLDTLKRALWTRLQSEKAAAQ